MIERAGLDDSFRVINCSHWAVGWIDELAIKLVSGPEEINLPAIQFFDNILNLLENYPVLDDEDYSRREYDACIEALENCYIFDLDKVFKDHDLSERWAEEVYDNMYEHGYDTTADSITFAIVREVVIALGYDKVRP